MNNVTLVGRLTKDPEIRYMADHERTCIARFSLAVNRHSKGEKQTDYPSIIVFGKQAEIAEKWLSKGSQVGITGRLQTGSYEKDGRKVYTTDVIANNIEFLDTRRKDEFEEGELPY